MTSKRLRTRVPEMRLVDPGRFNVTQYKSLECMLRVGTLIDDLYFARSLLFLPQGAWQESSYLDAKFSASGTP